MWLWLGEDGVMVLARGSFQEPGWVMRAVNKDAAGDVNI